MTWTEDDAGRLPPHALLGPRSPQRPMAFTGHELSRGAFITWCALAVLLALLQILAGVSSGNLFGWLGSTSQILVLALIVAAAGTVVGTGFAFLVGLALRRVRAWAVHIIAHGATAAALGALTIIAATTIIFERMNNWANPTSWVVLAACSAASAIAAIIGWVWTVQIALSEDAAYDEQQRTLGDDVPAQP